MKRLCLLICVIVVLPGCCGQSSNSATDPFYGYTRVPPPPTGSIFGQSADPYYPGSPSPTGSSIGQPNNGTPRTLPANPGAMAPVNPGTAPSWTPPGGSSLTSPNSNPSAVPGNTYGAPSGSTSPNAVPSAIPPASGGGSRYVPPGGSFNYQGQSATPWGSSATRVAPPSYANRAGTSGAVPHLADRTARPSQSTAASITSRAPIVQAVPPRPKATTTSNATGTRASGSSTQPRLATPRAQGIDIMDLPDPSRTTTPDRASADRQESGFRLVSDVDEASGENKVVAAVAFSDGNGSSAAQGRYGHDPEYRWLRGKLEHSQVDGCWKLRYIPIDGTTDEFGGSVVLPDLALLTGIERGEFIEARGKVGPREATEGFAPIYLATEIVKTDR